MNTEDVHYAMLVKDNIEKIKSDCSTILERIEKIERYLKLKPANEKK